MRMFLGSVKTLPPCPVTSCHLCFVQWGEQQFKNNWDSMKNIFKKIYLNINITLIPRSLKQCSRERLLSFVIATEEMAGLPAYTQFRLLKKSIPEAIVMAWVCSRMISTMHCNVPLPMAWRMKDVLSSANVWQDKQYFEFIHPSSGILHVRIVRHYYY